MAISKELSFLAKKDARSLATYTAAMTAYTAHLDSALKLKGDMPIFIDTNVLLRYYQISFAARTKLLKFFKDYSGRIYLTNTVQKEFLRNREDVIERFFNDVTEQLPESFEKEILNKIDWFLKNNKVILKDHVSTETNLNKIKAEAEKLHNKLKEDVKDKGKEREKLSFIDEFLEALNIATSLPALSDVETKLIQGNYDELTKGIPKDKSENLRPDKIFPGLGDYKRKPEDPYGDFIIYHEMLSFISTNKKNAIFLTYDTTKADWVQKNGKPFLHYIENVFSNTEHVLYILDAERIFEDLLDMSFKSLLVEKEKVTELDNWSITEDSILEFLSTNETLKHYKDAEVISPYVIFELKKNGYTKIGELERDISRSDKAMKHYKNYSQLNKVGGMRAALFIANNNYVPFNRSLKPSEDDWSARFEKYRVYLSDEN